MVRTEDAMQGQYKTVGGKLVAVDFEVREGRLSGVIVHGDFFLYPDDAFAALAAGLEEAAIELDEAALAERVRLALPAGAELVGTSPEAIAIAVKRGLATEEGAPA